MAHRRLMLKPPIARLPPPLEQLIAAELLGQRLDPVLADRRDRLRAQRDHLAGLLTQTGGRTQSQTAACRCGCTSVRTRRARSWRRTPCRGLAVSPGQHFAADRATLAHYLRLPFTATPEVLTRAVRLLSEHGAAQ